MRKAGDSSEAHVLLYIHLYAMTVNIWEINSYWSDNDNMNKIYREKTRIAANGMYCFIHYVSVGHRVCAYSNHTHDHVLAELEAYAPLTSLNSYCVVWDTGIQDLPEDFCEDRAWGKGNNPKTAVWEYLSLLKKEGRLASDGNKLIFEIDKTIEYKIAITASPDGFLLRV